MENQGLDCHHLSCLANPTAEVNPSAGVMWGDLMTSEVSSKPNSSMILLYDPQPQGTSHCGFSPCWEALRAPGWVMQKHAPDLPGWGMQTSLKPR